MYFQKGFTAIVLLAFTVIVISLTAGAYYLGTQKVQSNISTQINPASDTQNSPNSSYATKIPDKPNDSYVKYQHRMFHIGYTVFEIDVPSDWTAYTVYGNGLYDDPVTVYLGEAQNKTPDGMLNDIIRTVRVKFLKNKGLASTDPKTWSLEDQGELFDGYPLSGEWKNIKVNGIDAKSINTPTIGNSKDIVFIVKDDVIFTISYAVEGGDNTLLDQLLSTFKIVDTQYL